MGVIARCLRYADAYNYMQKTQMFCLVNNFDFVNDFVLSSFSTVIASLVTMERMVRHALLARRGTPALAGILLRCVYVECVPFR